MPIKRVSFIKMQIRYILVNSMSYKNGNLKIPIPIFN